MSKETKDEIQTDTSETWAMLPEHMLLSFYLFSSKGRIFSLYTNQMIKGSPTKAGYLRVNLTNDHGKQRCFQVARLIFGAFSSNFDWNKTVDHKNRVRDDNDLSNLREATMQEQSQNRNIPQYIEYTGYLILQICALDGHVMSYWRAIQEIIKKYPQMDEQKLFTSLSENIPVELENCLWIHQNCDIFQTCQFVWVDAIIPSEKYGDKIASGFKVCQEGLIKFDSGRITPGSMGPSGYRIMHYKNRNIFIHRIIYRTFKGPFPTEKQIVDHVDGISTNNHISNLDAVTLSENAQRASDLNRNVKV